MINDEVIVVLHSDNLSSLKSLALTLLIDDELQNAKSLFELFWEIKPLHPISMAKYLMLKSVFLQI